MRWAVFDVDGTLLPGTSMERMAVRRPWNPESSQRPCCGPLPAVRIAGLGAARKPDSSRNKDYFRVSPGAESPRSQEEMSPAGRRSTDPPRPAEMEGLRRKGFRILLFSGAPDFMLHPLALGHRRGRGHRHRARNRKRTVLR